MRPALRGISARPGTWPSTASTSTPLKRMSSPESAPALQEIAKLLQQDPKLNLYIVGHTDTVGEFPDEHGPVAPARGRGAQSADYHLWRGAGPAAGLWRRPIGPVASNRDEEGRAKNRRVELVER